MHFVGRGVPQDYAEALKWSRLAAAQGQAFAQNNLAVMYADGKGVAQNLQKAHMWFGFAAVSGYPAAAQGRDGIAKRLTTPQLAEAEKMARDCQASNFKNCD